MISPPEVAGAGSVDDASSYWHERYMKERKKSRLLFIVAGSLVIFLLGALFYAANFSSETRSQTGDSTLPFGSTPERPSEPRGFGEPAPDGAPRGGAGPEQFLGEADPGDALRSMIDEFTADSGFLGEQLREGLDAAVANGLMTREQADQLLADLGFSAEGSTS